MSDKYGIDYNGSAIGMICNGKQFRHGKHTFCFIDEKGNDIPTGYIYKGTTEIIVVTPEHKILKYHSVADAAKELNIERSSIFNALNYLDHRLTKGHLINYRFYRESEYDENEDIHSEKLLQDMKEGKGTYTRIYKLTKPDGTISYFTTVKEICSLYNLDPSTAYRNYNKTIGRGKFKGWRIDTIDKEDAVQTRVRSKNNR